MCTIYNTQACAVFMYTYCTHECMYMYVCMYKIILFCLFLKKKFLHRNNTMPVAGASVTLPPTAFPYTSLHTYTCPALDEDGNSNSTSCVLFGFTSDKPEL